MGQIQRRARRPLTRRDFLAQAGLGAASLPWLAGCGADSGARAAGEAGSVFRHGVASGDPLRDRVIFWTRISGSDGPVPVSLSICQDPALRQPVASVSATTDASRDHTVKLDVAGLSPGTTYYYRFSALGEQSPIGRTRTAPDDTVEQLRFGVVSCASAAHGYFNAYRALAARADLDAILHTGDYLYEYGTGEYGDLRPYEPEHEILSLADYRTRHAYYKKDPDLMELHRQFPFITTWDDHESADNSWRDGAVNHSEGEEGVWVQRKAWAQQAYDEWMPIRYPQSGNTSRIWRSFRYGDLAEIFVLDSRLYDRDEPGAIPADSALSAAPDRRMLGPEQMNWLLDGLASSASRWKIICQQMVFHQWQLGDPGTTGAGLYLNGDAWDGYQAERARILAHLRDQTIDNVVVLSGDVHSSWCADITENPLDLLSYDPLRGGSAAVEFTCPSITSPFAIDIPEGQQAFIANNPHIRYLDFDRRGYVLLNLDPGGVQGEYWYVDSHTEPDNPGESFATAYRSDDGANHLSILALSSPSTPASPAPPLAP